MRHAVRRRDLTHATVALCAVLAGCDISIEPEDGPTLVRFVNAAPDAIGPLRFVLSGVPSAVLQRGESSTYTTVEPRVYAVLIEDETEGWTVDGNVRIVQGLYQTLYAFGDSNDGEVAILVGDEPTPPASGRSLLRFLHFASALTAGVDVHILADGEAVDPQAPVLSDRPYASQPLYFFVTAGSRRIVLTTPGTNDVIIDSGLLQFTSGAWYTTVFLNDDVGEPEVILLRDGVDS